MADQNSPIGQLLTGSVQTPADYQRYQQTLTGANGMMPFATAPPQVNLSWEDQNATVALIGRFLQHMGRLGAWTPVGPELSGVGRGLQLAAYPPQNLFPHAQPFVHGGNFQQNFRANLPIALQNINAVQQHPVFRYATDAPLSGVGGLPWNDWVRYLRGAR